MTMNLVTKCGLCFALGDEPSARVPPLENRLKPNSRPYRCKFLAKFNAELVKLGWVYENKQSRLAYAALPDFGNFHLRKCRKKFSRA
ncbi:Hypothetical protein PHPALM_8817 [Phytophthora palmivora]|uniref:Uncharacterized protein n=1 Tax=Phytophthora palmivora TaxID=4796 RepID=A0A2P4Y8X2_9STRA|nr:Hypothetical protein PHPALM_8817 [Phytophthora palmivora]